MDNKTDFDDNFNPSWLFDETRDIFVKSPSSLQQQQQQQQFNKKTSDNTHLLIKNALENIRTKLSGGPSMPRVVDSLHTQVIHSSSSASLQQQHYHQNYNPPPPHQQHHHQGEEDFRLFKRVQQGDLQSTSSSLSSLFAQIGDGQPSPNSLFPQIGEGSEEGDNFGTIHQSHHNSNSHQQHVLHSQQQKHVPPLRTAQPLLKKSIQTDYSKSQRERDRRNYVNGLFYKLAKLVGVDDGVKDKTFILEAAKKYLEDHLLQQHEPQQQQHHEQQQHDISFIQTHLEFSDPDIIADDIVQRTDDDEI